MNQNNDTIAKNSDYEFEMKKFVCKKYSTARRNGKKGIGILLSFDIGRIGFDK